MRNDRKVIITTGNHRRSANWQPLTLYLSEFYEKLRVPARGTETMRVYLALKKSQQDDLKDVGGYVAGGLTGTRRKAAAVAYRDVITLDMDNIPPGGTDDLLRRIEGLGCGYCVYSTRKHSPAAPRLRILLPLNRPATPDEYEPVARKMAEAIGMEYADPTTFDVARLMYWPSCCADGEYIYTWQDKPLLSVDGLLALYANWRDVASWPRAAGEHKHTTPLAKQADPTDKDGIVGAFCRAYDVPAAMSAFLPDVYEPVDGAPDRYTYVEGSTIGGAVVYDGGKYMFSHHATDPCGGRLVNSFDMVRLHKFDELDAEAAPGTPGGKLPSYAAMCDMAAQDAEVKRQRVRADFADIPDDAEWTAELEQDKNGYEKSYKNIALLLENHPKLVGRIKYDSFSERIIGSAPLPWGSRADETEDFDWADTDDAGLKIFVEHIFGWRAPEIINTTLTEHFAKHSFNPVADYLTSLTWDGIPRLDTLLVDYLGADDTEYTRAVTRKAFTAAVARAYEPGTKFDYMLVLISDEEGIGKSTLLYKMARGRLNDNILTFEGNKASEALQGSWLIEVAEMHALAKTDVNRIKQFLTQREDVYRQAYGRRTESHPRRCVFFGTGNDAEFITTSTGGRRFWPVNTGINDIKKHVFEDLDGEVDQIWAEAVIRWKAGEPLYLSSALEELIAQIRDEHRTIDPWADDILEFVEREVPEDWLDWSTEKRKIYWGNGSHSELKTVPRTTISAGEIWNELFHQPLVKLTKREAIAINNILKTIPGWKRNGVGRVGPERKLAKHFIKIQVGNT